MRLAKFLAHAGVASRRAAEGIVAGGRVTVDGEVVTDPARDVDETSGVALDGRRVAPEPHEVHALNKPAGVVSTARDTHGRPTVVQLVRSPRRLYPVGRLDADTTGLILLTNDGELAERLTHPRYGVKKVYRARIQPARVSPRALEALREGVEIEDGRTAPAEVRQPAPGILELTIREGRKRQVRRMVEAVGHRVVELERVAFGPLGLRGLEPGKSRRLTKPEVERLRRLSEPRSGRPPRGRAPGARAKPAREGAAKPTRGSGAKPRPAPGAGKPRAQPRAGKPRAGKPRARRRPQS
jgi:23S rRNA pseudouridine2605 synthase